MMTRRLQVLWLCASLMAATSLAHADDDKARKDAQARFDEGLARVKASDYEGGRLAFTQAYSVLKTREVLFNLALAEFKTKHALDALTHLHTYLKDPAISEDERNQARRLVVDASTKVGHVALQQSPGGALHLDGQLVEANDGVLDVEPGKHTVDVDYDGTPKRVDIDVSAGATANVDLRREAKAIEGPVVVHDIVEEKREKVAWPPPPQSIVLGSLALVALGVGVGFSVDAGHQSDVYSTMQPGVCANPQSADCLTRQSALDGHSRDTTVSTVMYVSGAVALIGAVVTWIAWPSTLRVQPTVGTAQLRITF